MGDKKDFSPSSSTTDDNMCAVATAATTFTTTSGATIKVNGIRDDNDQCDKDDEHYEEVEVLEEQKLKCKIDDADISWVPSKKQTDRKRVDSSHVKTPLPIISKLSTTANKMKPETLVEPDTTTSIELTVSTEPGIPSEPRGLVEQRASVAQQASIEPKAPVEPKSPTDPRHPIEPGTPLEPTPPTSPIDASSEKKRLNDDCLSTVEEEEYGDEDIRSYCCRCWKEITNCFLLFFGILVFTFSVIFYVIVLHLSERDYDPKHPPACAQPTLQRTI
ncbi:hypothetical protein HELRODRAFT_192781 [Helobdella robusta]|uniref:Uncharacterized protein n=1 Tax=Helobdella robusta TaxID=6412 RepID=T1FUA1_HELRO|nr:hypothetical protein HELRODRAFT_192781 [Helobdella robusta]ESN99768.1 hypothetical protein HELRODRAFT_192781 [Helobdella robusta]